MEAPLNLKEFEDFARERLPREIFEWYARGAADDITLRENETAWIRPRLRPRVCVDVSSCELRTTILGREVAMPVMTAPCSLNTMAHPEGEMAVARATAAAGIVQVLSTGATFSIEEVAAAAPAPRWFQIYCLRERSITRALAERAEAAGYAALCLTVDAPFDGIREHNARNRFQAPPSGIFLANFKAYMNPDRKFYHDSSLTWEGVEWVRGLTRLPLVLKGILTAEDARLAVGHGVKGIIVSNHGGRQLDTVVPTCAALREVAEAAGGQAEVYVDGGIRRGTDVLKALALGARAVLIGRPYLWALAVDGEAGVGRMLAMLREELRIAMALSGCATIGEVKPGVIAAL